MTRSFGAVPLAAFLLLISAEIAGADGCYFPEKAFATPPAIPMQRALLAWQDGKETLVIESALDAPGQVFGWIIPLPAEPTSVKKVSPGLLKTLDALCQPTVYNDLLDPGLLLLAVPCALVALYYLWKFLREKRTAWTSRHTLDFLILIAVIVILNGMLMSAGGGYSGGYARGVEIRQSLIVGNYDIKVLRAKGAAELNEWLAANGLGALPVPGQTLVNDYVREGWCFVAARLQLTEKGPRTPHPLEMSFPAKQAIYPMRLTALAGKPVWLDLFVVGKERVSAKGMTCWYSGAKHYEPPDPDLYRPITYRKHHPDLQRLVPEGFTLTRLTGTLNPRDMRRDILPEWKPGAPYRKLFFSRRAAIQVGVQVGGGIGFLGVVLILLTGFHREWLAEPGGRWRYAKRVLVPLCGISLVALLFAYWVLPKVGVRSGTATYEMRWHVSDVERGILPLASPDAENRDRAFKSLDDIRAAITAGLQTTLAKTALTNPFTGRPVIEEDSPGNYTITETANQFLIRVYDGRGRITEFAVPKAKP